MTVMVIRPMLTGEPGAATQLAEAVGPELSSATLAGDGPGRQGESSKDVLQGPGDGRRTDRARLRVALCWDLGVLGSRAGRASRAGQDTE